MQEIDIWVIHPNSEACSALSIRLEECLSVRVICGRFEELEPHDCFVTAGNSYGLMTAGIDAAVAHFFAEAVVRRVQHRILDEYLGEQPVGTAFIVETGNPHCSCLCHSPTMRTPGCIDGTDRIYAATWAALLAVHNYNVGADRPIRTVAFPAMGTGFGGVSFDECARQMAAAFHHFRELPHRSLDWDWVTAREKRICYDGKERVCR
jgi:O-acetyl-ADP-ribose deacetylase (regulator of RNase III)